MESAHQVMETKGLRSGVNIWGALLMTHPERVEIQERANAAIKAAFVPLGVKELVRDLMSLITASEKRAETARDDALENAARRFDNLETPIEPHLIARTIRAMKGQRS